APQELLSICRTELRPNERQAALATGDRRHGSARGTSSDPLLCRGIADDRRPFLVCFLWLVWDLLLRPRRQVAVAARPWPAQYAAGLGRGGDAGGSRRLPASKLGPGGGFGPHLPGGQDGQDQVARPAG